LFNVIENNHNVTSEQIQVARRQRNRVFDAAVVLLFVPIYSLATIVVSRRISNRFSADGRYIRLAATALAAVPVSVLGVQCFRLFAAVWETVRVGNGHMTSLRAASYNRWTQHYASADFVGAALLFWFIVWFCYRAADRSYAQRLPDPAGTRAE
jgi:hypothetical protein